MIEQDIKPDNLFLSESGVIKMGDYGVAAQLKHPYFMGNNRHGTSWYTAPEEYVGRTELKSDVWSLGITLIELAEGKNPYRLYTALQVMRLVCDGQPPSLSSSEWSAEFVDFVNKCLVKDVEERWSVEQLMEVRDWEMVKA